MNGTYNKPISEQQRRMIYALSKKLSLEQPTGLANFTSAQASAQIEQLVEVEKQRETAPPAQMQQATPAAQPTAALIPGVGLKSSYNQYVTGMCWKAAAKHLMEKGHMPSGNVQMYAELTAHLYITAMAAEISCTALHNPPEASGGGSAKEAV